MTTATDQQRLFTEKAQSVSAQVHVTSTLQKVFEYAIELCERANTHRTAEIDGDTSSSPALGGPNRPEDMPTIAAPALSDEDFALLKSLCEEKKIHLIHDNLRGNLHGIDVGCTYADFGIAETGTLVINSTNEDLRLATMISDVHLAILPLSRIRNDATALAADLQSTLADPANYTAFITGPSRTADIERVLAIGVHGPLELHILLLEDGQC